MDQNIVLLSALYFLNQKQLPISEITIRHLQVILSLFIEEILSESDMEYLVESLKDDGFITQKNEKIILSREGAALANSISVKLIGQTALSRLHKMLEDYGKDKTRYIKNLSEQLKSFQEMRQNKVKFANKSMIRAVGVIMELKHKRSELFAHRFKLDHQIMRNEDKLSSEINFSARKFIKSTGRPIIARREDSNTLKIISFTQIPSFTVFNQDLEPVTIDKVKREDVVDWNLISASTLVENYLNELGYVRSGWPGRTFTKYQEFKKTASNMGSLRESESLNIDFTELYGDQLFVWVESFKSPTKRVIDFLYESKQDMADGEGILACLDGLKLRRIPSGTEIKLKGVLPNKDLSVEIVPSTQHTFKEYWRRTYGIEPSKKIQPLMIIEGGNSDFHYPAEMIHIDKFSLEKHLGKSQSRKPKPETPSERFRITQNLFNLLRKVSQKEENPFYRVAFKKYTPKVGELCELGAFEDALQILPPMLQFQANNVSLDPMDVFNYGPVCGLKSIAVSHLVIPNDKSNHDVSNVMKALRKMFSGSNLGKIYRSKDIKIVRYDSKVGKQDLEKKVRGLSKIKGDNNIAIAVIPDGDKDIYFTLKRLFPIITGVPIQSIRLSTFQSILGGKFRGSQYLSLKILVKSLKKGEGIWTLGNAAGLSQEKTLFVGIGFSRFPREGKVSKCATVLHDSRGNKVSWKVFPTFQERSITKPWFDNLLHRVRDFVEVEKPTRLLFYRTGTMYPQELEAVEISLQECHWIKSTKISFVSILDVGNFRFYMYDHKYRKYRNVPAGYGIVIDETEAFLSSSNYDDRELRNGTVIPIRLKVELGDENIVDILKEYHDLTYLNWLAPRTTSKYPLVITIAERFAELTRENISAESMFYLDL